MRVDIGNKLDFIFQSNITDLPLPNSSYLLLKEYLGNGQFIEAHFKFNTDKIFFKLEIDEEVIIDLDVKSYNSFNNFKNKDNAFVNKFSLMFDDYDKILTIKLPLPIQYRNSIKFYAKSNDGNIVKKSEGYCIILNKENN